MKTLTDNELKQIIGGLNVQLDASEIHNLNENPTCVCHYINAIASTTNENTADSCKCKCNIAQPEPTPTPSLSQTFTVI